MPAGKRRAGLAAMMSELLRDLFARRILSFDEPAARAYGQIIARGRAARRAISIGDGQIAAIAAVHGFTVATRDPAPFLVAGVPIINPWVADV